MNKLRFILGVLLVIGTTAFAGMSEQKVVQFGANGAGVSLTLPGENGYILDKTMYIDVQTNASMSMYFASQKTKAQAASTSTTIVLYTQASNTLNGVVLTTSDYLLVQDSAGAYSLGNISAIGNYNSTSNTTQYTLAANTSVSANGSVFVVDSTDIKTFPCKASSDQTDLYSIFAGKRNMPVHLTVPVTGGSSIIIGGVYSIVR